MYIIGLDIGSMHIKGVLAEITEDEHIKIVASACSKHKGAKSGIITNLEEVKGNIDKVVRKINDKNEDIEKYIVNVSGISVNDYYGKSTIPLWKKDGDNKRIKVTKNHYNEVIESAKISYLEEKSKIIHTLPQSFQVDDQPSTMTPIGMSGYKMEGKVYIIQSEKNHLENINTVLYDCNIKDYELVFSPIATAEAFLEKEDKETGVVVINLGAQITEVAIYQEGVLVKSSIIPLGSDFVTRDLMKILKIDYSSAEDLKINHGNTFLDDLSDDDILNIKSSTLVEDSDIKVKHIAEIIAARMEEIYKFVFKIISENNYQKNTCNFLLTGSGIKLAGAKKLFEQVNHTRLSIPVISGIEIDDDLDESFYATSLGLVKYAVNNSLLDIERDNSSHDSEKSFFQKAKSFLKDLI